MRDEHYKILSVRLSKENLAWLKKEKEQHQSWNLLFNKLIEKYDPKTNNNKSSKRVWSGK